jgi:peptide deformylase
MKIVSTTDLQKIPPVLRERAEEVRDISEITPLIEDFLETLKNSEGVGLAATQVGVTKRFFAVSIPANPEKRLPGVPPTLLINPEIIKRSKEQLRWQEGCLSLPGWRGMTTRAESVKVRALNRFGKKVTVKADGLFACAIQHELDHLDGILFIDHANEITREEPQAPAKKEQTGKKNSPVIE